MSNRKKGSHSAEVKIKRIYARAYVHPKDDINLLKGGLKR